MPESTVVLYEVSERIATVTLNRPAARNALSSEVLRLLPTHLAAAEADDGVDVVILTGTDPAFCAGLDLKELGSSGGNLGGGGGADGRANDSGVRGPFPPMTKPLIGAVNGVAVTGGFELALNCDFLVASERAKFGELFVLRGLVCDVAGLGRLAGLVGREKATELLLTGELIDAQEAQRIGLVSRVVPHAELLPAALALAERIAANPPLAIARIKQGLRRALDPDWQALGTFVSSSLAELFRSEDHREGVRAFLEKRPPSFRGR